MKFLILAGLAMGVSFAQTPSVTNARFETRTVAGDSLRSIVTGEAGPVWIGYAVESQRPNGDSCCWNQGGACGCRLEDGDGSVNFAHSREPVKLENSSSLMVLYRVENHAIGKIRPVSVGCALDAGGLRFVWLTGVTGEASIRFLTEYVQARTEKRDTDTALAAIAMHRGSAADETLERFASQSQPEWMREKALFWLASARGERGFAILKQAAENDPSDSIREKAMFDLSVTPVPAGTAELIRFAKQDPSARVRGQALFWLGQKAGEKAVAAIGEAVKMDPDVEVKKKAVFALQQLPNGQGVTMLIEVARTHPNPEVRKQAMFWLGQSGDPRALHFFENVLTGKP